jgi:hypothetical protein
MTNRRHTPHDLPGLADDVPPSGDLTPDQEATRAASPGFRDTGPTALDETLDRLDAQSEGDEPELEVDTGHRRTTATPRRVSRRTTGPDPSLAPGRNG